MGVAHRVWQRVGEGQGQGQEPRPQRAQWSRPEAAGSEEDLATWREAGLEEELMNIYEGARLSGRRRSWCLWICDCVWVMSRAQMGRVRTEPVQRVWGRLSGRAGGRG